MAFPIDRQRWRGRVRIGLLVALAAFTLDQATKLLAAGLHASYFKNADSRAIWWFGVPLLIFTVGTLIPSKGVAIGVGLILGAATGNMVDSLLWPGGVPDFITAGPAHTNVADILLLIGFLIALVFGAVFILRLLLRLLRRGVRARPCGG